MPKKPAPFPVDALEESVITFPTEEGPPPGGLTLTFAFSAADNIVTPWGRNVQRRDRELRAFALSENMLQSALYSVAARNAAFEWEIEGTPETKRVLETMLNNAIVHNSKGWIPFIMALTQDFMGTDNGMFIEVIRDIQPKHRGKEWTAPVVGIAHLDSNMCQRTGNPDVPVIYHDFKGRRHKMRWWSIIGIAEMPSANQNMFGVGICAISRILRAASILKSIAQLRDEKISGRFVRQINFVGGVGRREIDDVKKQAVEIADSKGLARYLEPIIIAGLDPQNPINVETLNLAALPEGFDYDSELKWYITQLSLAFGVDYQDFAPLPGGNLGTATQSEVLHLKSRGKGSALWMQMLQDIFYWYGIFPSTARFVFAEQDLSAEMDEAKLRGTRAAERKTRLEAGEITPQVAREIALEQGDLTQEQFDSIDEDFGMDTQLPDDPTEAGMQRPDENLEKKRQSKSTENVDAEKRVWWKFWE